VAGQKELRFQNLYILVLIILRTGTCACQVALNGNFPTRVKHSVASYGKRELSSKARMSTANLLSSLVATGCPRWWPMIVVGLDASCPVGEAVTVACCGDDVGVVAEPVKQ